MEILLQPEELFSLPDNPRGVRLHCTAGELWITQQGDSRDHLLRSGQSYATGHSGSIVVMALMGSRFSLMPEAKAVPRSASWSLKPAAG